MKQLVIVLGTIVLGLGGTAQAANNHPKQAKQVKVSFVTAYEQCTTGPLVHRPPLLNSVDSCVPALTTEKNPAHKIIFGTDGSAVALIRVGAGDVKITFKAAGILDNVSGFPYGGSLLALVSLRVTDHACGEAATTPCTVADMSLPIPIGCTAGTCNGIFRINTLFANLIKVGDEGNVELGQIVVRDPDGDDAFRQGLFLP